ncbi:alkylated DNA repair protein AlkB [Kwoniella dejecticola CBS 10117]|uniref:Alkylated DNA repair protein AlkB n=1 Tax=Kwoniella dejecticola CBS 10117 TaxID=1296121 RepID=A0A1A6AGJ7_9TREE|nr:alkylated DNA repair protein AlkB [Kwoniella dejecticola CBS 10117]OBR89195.1 alkylated DNA repair protein AlkB [Kwoniella dejecticola CBS 10117]
MVSHDAKPTQHTAFRLAEKHFKNRALKDKYPSLRKYQDKLIDLSRPDQQEDDPLWKAGWWSPWNDYDGSNSSWKAWVFGKGKGKERDLGERPILSTSEMTEIQLSDGKAGWIVAPGCILIPNFLPIDKQLDLLHASIAEYTQPPSPLSVSTHYTVPPNLFQLYSEHPDHVVQPKHLTLGSKQVGGPENAPRPRKTVETEPASVIGYDEIIARNKTWAGDAPSDKVKERTVAQLMAEMRWANLGWVYQWSTKSYDFSSDKPIPFPPDLADICKQVVRSVRWSEIFLKEPDSRSCGWESWAEDYEPDTGIVNFYQIGDTLMGHVDRSELDPARPLVSLSLGHSAILLLGSASRHDPPRPIVLRSGDCLIMSAAGRQAYHGVPRILEGTLPAHFEPADEDNMDLKAAKRFIATARVNINARQVFPPGFKRPPIVDSTCSTCI